MTSKYDECAVSKTTHLPPAGAQEFGDKTKTTGQYLLRLGSLAYSLALAVVFCGAVGFSEAATYYVATDGDDGNTCGEAQDSSTAKHTIAQGIACLSSGDTLIIKSGTYNEGLYNPPSGSSSAAMTTVKGAPGESVIIKPDNAAIIIAVDEPRSYISIENLTVDGNNKLSGFGAWVTASHIRFNDLQFQQIAGDVVAVFHEDDNQEGSGSNEFTNVRIHDSGAACDSTSRDVCLPTHGFYVSTSDNLFEGVVVDGVPGHGIVIYDSSGSRKAGNIIRNSEFHNNGVGVSLFAGDDTIVEDNLFENNSLDIWVGAGSTNTMLRNNTVDSLGDSGIYVDSLSSGTQIID